MSNKVIAYTILRIVMGINMFMHGAVRFFGDYAGFANGVVNNFSGTVLPEVLVRLVGWSIPPVELIIGLSLILGLFTAFFLVISGVLMATLVFGMSLLQNWGTVADQMLYTLLFSALLFGLEYNQFSIDNIFLGQAKSD